MNFGFEQFDSEGRNDPAKNALEEVSPRRAVDDAHGADASEHPTSVPRQILTQVYKRRFLLILAGLLYFAHSLSTGYTVTTLIVGLSVTFFLALVTPPIGAWLGLSEQSVSIDTNPDKDHIIKHSFQAMVDALPDPTILLTKEGSLVYFNAEAADLLGDLQSGLHISSVIRNPEFLDAVTRAYDAPRPITVYYSGRVPIGRHISSVIARIVPQTDSPEAPRLLATFKDLTQLERINQMRADFIANASHELRTPLASLMGFIETLQGSAKDDPEARERFLNIMSKQATRMTRLINDLLSLSRVEMNAHLLPSDRVDINDTVRYVVDTMEPLAREAQKSLTINALTGPLYVRGERDELVQVFQNLIQNAIKYSNPHGHIDVALQFKPGQRGQAGTVIILVEDDGPGISPEHLPRLTERFYRVDVTSSRDKGGTGLGLAIVKHIITRHRGELTIDSTPGKGSKFAVTLREWVPINRP